MARSDDDQNQQAVLRAFAKQIEWCAGLGSPFTARLLTVLADDIAGGGISADFVRAWPGDPIADALALRIAGALHALVLTETAPAPVACYPPHAATMEQLRPIVPTAVEEHRSFIQTFLSIVPQTNEVGRSGVLVGGFLQIAEETGLPLRLLEFGASAGLNTVWDRYHYQFGAAEWGDRQSAVRITPHWEGQLPVLNDPVQVVERFACDLDRQLNLRTLLNVFGSGRTFGPTNANGCPDWKAPSAWRASMVQELTEPRRRLGQSKAARTCQSEGNRPLPFHHVAISCCTDSGGHPGEPSARRRPSYGSCALGLAASSSHQIPNLGQSRALPCGRARMKFARP